MLRGALKRVSEAGWNWRVDARRAGRAVILGLIRRLPAVTRTVAWAAVAVSLGVVIGLAAIVLPPTGAFGIVAVAGLALVWALPDLPAVPVRTMRLLFVLVLVAYLCVPNYYAIQFVGLPWITIRRLFAFPLIIVFALAIGGSSQVRGRIIYTIRTARFVSFFVIGFYVSILFSILTSANPAGSLSGTVEASFAWYVPWLALSLVIENETDLLRLLRLIGWCAIFISLAGVLEFVLQHRYFIDVIPKPILAGMMENNPTFKTLVNTSPYRNGLYRASSIFENSLSFGEFAAIVAPFGYAFFCHEETWQRRGFGLTIVLSSIIAIYVSGARGAYVSFLVSTAVFAGLWVIRTSLSDRRRRLAPAVVVFLAIAGFAAVILLILFWGRAHNMVLGSAVDQNSSEARFTQWAMAIPKIIRSPITGNGFDMGAEVVGFANSGAGFPTLDSYVISVLVENGIPGFLLFVGMVVAGIWMGVREYLSDPSTKGGLAGGLACSLVAFGVYRLVLSQKENHTLLYLLIGALVVLARVKRDQRLHEKGAASSSARVRGFGQQFLIPRGQRSY